MTRPRRPTIRDVAHAAGVSTGTVSRYLNGGHWVSDHAQRAIARAIEITGYTANQSARTLVTGRSNSIAYLMTETSRMPFADPTYALLLRGIAVEMARRGRTLVVLVAGTQEERTTVSRYIRAGHVDGVLLISPHADDPLVAELVDEGVPMASSGRPLGFEDRVHHVTIDEAGGAALATRHLLDLGRRRLGMIVGPEDTPGGRLRRAGFERAMGDRFERDLVVTGDYGRPSGAAAMRELLRRAPDLDGVFAAADAMALGALDVLQDRGVAVPGDVALVGFDDSGPAAESRPALTTVRQPWERIVDELVRLVLAAVDGAPVQRVELTTTLTRRESA